MLKRRNKMFFSVLFSLGLICSVITYNLYGCSSRKRTIAVSYMTMNNPFYSVINNEILKAVESRGDTLITLDPLLSVERQEEQVQRMLEADVDGLIVNPIDYHSLESCLVKAQEKGIPVVIIDSPLECQNLAEAVITSDNYKAGVLCARDLMKKKTSAHILLLEHSGAVSAQERIQGFTDTLAQNKNYVIEARAESLGQLEIAMPAVLEVLRDCPEVDTIMALNDPSALGAMGAVQSLNRTDISIYGVDGTPDMKMKLLETCSIEATAAQSPVSMGQAAVETMYAIFENRPYERQQVLDVVLVDRSNVRGSNPNGWN